PAGMYEFWANHPQSLHQVTILMSDRGIPASYRNMNGYASHTLSFWNKNGERFWVKWHFKTDQGIKTLSNEESEKQSSHGNQEDLVNAIDRGEFPSWTVKVQLMPEADASTYKVNPFDLTKVWSHTDYPLLTIGKLVLDKNVQNYFAETEQATFTPGNLVPGIGASPDKVLQARLLSYGDAHRYRVGANHNQLPVNAPRCPVHHYQRDGAMAGTCPVQGMQGNQGSEVNFYPNDRINAGAPSPDPSIAEPPLQLDDATVDRFDTMPEDNFSQAGDLFRLMSESQKDQLARNIAGGLVQAHLDIQTRMLAQFEQADPDYRARVEDLL
ncbi:MAG TPA: catalase, partial [Bacteroidetes bacterium]|nr:catalase [Bacteroidota bacterium]